MQLLDGYVQAEKSEQAATLANELLDEARQTLPEDSIQLASKLTSLGSSLIKAKAYSDAERFSRESLDIREKISPTSWLTFSAKSQLGEALCGQKKYDEAEPLLLSGYEGMKKRETTISKSSANVLPDSLDRLIELYKATDKPDEMAKWQTERVKYSNN